MQADLGAQDNGNDQAEDVQFDVANNGNTGSSNLDPSDPDYGKVSCPFCTFLNYQSATTCAVCESPLS